MNEFKISLFLRVERWIERFCVRCSLASCFFCPFVLGFFLLAYYFMLVLVPIRLECVCDNNNFLLYFEMLARCFWFFSSFSYSISLFYQLTLLCSYSNACLLSALTIFLLLCFISIYILAFSLYFTFPFFSLLIAVREPFLSLYVCMYTHFR